MIFYWNCQRLTITVNGQPISGFGEEDILTIKRKSGKYTTHTGIDGESTRTETADDNYQVTITLSPGFDSYNFLKTLSVIDEITGGIKLNLSVKDNNTGWTFAAPNSYFTVTNEEDLGKSSSENTFDITSYKPTWGNTNPEIQSLITSEIS